jgi:predicted nucleic acid-binding protein
VFVVDTNVLVYAADRSATEHARCRELLVDWRETARHAEVLANLVQAVPQLRGNLLHDAHTAALMHEHGIRAIYTRDTDFHRFPDVEIRDPLE